MCAYSTINGQAACQNDYLMETTLDQRWGYPGFVTSDYQATHSTVQSADAGLDQEMPAPQYYGSALQAAVQDGQVSMATLNGMVSRILTEMFKFNEFNNPPTGSTSAIVTTPAHQAVSTSVAEAGTVLLKNTGGTLPLSANGAGTVAVIGPAASASPTDTGGGSAYVTSTFNVTPLQGIQAAAGTGTTVQYAQGLPTDTSLSAIPSADLTPAYASTNYGETYTGTLTAPETGTYVLAFQNPGSYTATNLSLDGKEILANPGTPPVSTYSVGVNLTAGQTYTLELSGGGPSANLSWATPSELAPGIDQAVAAAKSAATAVVVVSDDTESEAADRASLNLPSAQNELISAVAAANPHTVVVVDAGAPVVMPWLNQVASVVDAWYPGESNGTALACGPVRPGRPERPPAGHLPDRPFAGARVQPEPVPRGGRPGAVLRGHRRRLPLLRRHQRDAAVPVRLRPVLHELPLQRSEHHPAGRPERHVEPRREQLRVQRPVEPRGDGVRHGHQHRQGGRLGRGPAVPG